ncbi:hypothetical protein OEZ85_010419 [Tetradesmus obliquus]|uniref:Uncharacterized protein n=1 Tax=Tetradesmus obliquus TaxID=3088 RepID=A0ABY8TPC7_TETOB|nr:hypothetical protein OEZ85_010419 [Tetradesmus obliquus]
MQASFASLSLCGRLAAAAAAKPGGLLAAATAALPWASQAWQAHTAGGLLQQQQQISSLTSLSSLHATASAALGGDAQHFEDAAGSAVDPFALVRDEVSIVSDRLCQSIVSNVPALEQAAEYFFRPGVRGKRLRPTLLLLMSSALSEQPPPPELLLPDHRPPHERPQEQRRRQQRIAEIAELIHVASLLHDDVLDDAETRRGISSLNASSGNKLAILAGDFLLARASVTLASLQNTEIVELLSRVLEHLVAGEVMQMSAGPEQLTSMAYYLDKTYYKTASLMANSSRAVAILGEQQPEVADLAWQYGRHLGLAFQIVDDLLDILGSSKQLGKPALNDMRAGLATAPVLFAAEEQPGLIPLIKRKFKGETDVQAGLQMVQQSSGIQRAKELAAHHAQLAAQQIEALPQSSSPHALAAREALINITHRVLVRSK